MALSEPTKGGSPAIQKAFMRETGSGIVLFLPEDIRGHAPITPELYADALTETAEEGEYSPMRQFLLENADQYDLEAVKKKPGYACLIPDVRNEIEEALKTAASEGTRTRTYDIQTVEKAEATFANLGHPGISEEVFNIIGDSLMHNPPKKQKGQTASTKAPEKVASDVTSTLTTKTESSKIRKRKGGKGNEKGKGKKKGRK